LSLAALLATSAWSCGSFVPLESVRATVSLSEPERFYEAGASLRLSASIFNSSQRTIRAGGGLLSGARLELVDAEGRVLKPAPNAAGPGTVLRPGERTRVELDLAALFLGLAEPGEYLLTAVYPQFRSNTVRFQIIPAFEPEAEYRAVVETDRGTFTLSFFPDMAPGHVRNFVNLARSGFYDNTIFHRVLPGTLIQGGDPTGTGHGGPGYTIRAEFNERRHVRGTLSMARRTDDPNSAGSQWFICLDRAPDWDGLYTVFGEVVDGMETVDRIGSIREREGVPLETVTLSQVTIIEAGQG
jgi:peptidyl-prolyl cis-trans isomerase B (cyclophilin B)